MTTTAKYIAGLSLAIIALIGFNVYQWNNPKVVEVPAGQAEIDSTAWVQRTAYTERGTIIDSLEAQNEALAKKVKDSKDKIANYTSITGKLKLKVDSLENQEPVRIDSFMTTDLGVQDTTVEFNETFGNGLFRVQSDVIFKWPYLDNEIYLTQQRDIRIDVANTFNDSRTRMLTYVTSPDFDSLKYQSYTQLEPKNELPKFWIGAGVGVAGTLAAIILLN